MIRYLIPLFALLSLLLFAADDSRGLKTLQAMKKEQRIALVVGNNDYMNLADLKNPINDARAMREILRAKGFEVLYAEDATLIEFKKLIKRFGTRIAEGGVGLFYFAGHGIQVDGNNFLVASDSDISDKDEVEFRTIALNYVTNKMKRAHNRFNILILDACRNDPFSRSGGGGLAPVSARGIFVAYATEAGSVAKDGRGSNGVFTKHLIRYIDQPLRIEEVFKRTREDVYTETDHEQFPGVYNQSMGDFFFTFPTASDVAKAKEQHIAMAKKAVPSIRYSDTVRDHGDWIEPAMVRIKAGEYMMGSNEGNEWERPKHRVVIPRDFFLSKYEVTVGEFKKFIRESGYRTDIEKNPERGCQVFLNRGVFVDGIGGMVKYQHNRNWQNLVFSQSDREPVVCISYNDAKAYIDWLNKKSRKKFRLPTEAEWEYAARAGTTSKYSFGDNDDDLEQFAWNGDNSDDRTHPVGTKKPNRWGLYDMHGNVWEWCEDWYAENYNDAPTDGSANTAGPRKSRSIRGGSWWSTYSTFTNPTSLRPEGRGGRMETDGTDRLGFRLAGSIQ